MPQRIYEVIGENKSPAVFEENVFRAFRDHKQLAITACEKSGDELATRRSPAVSTLEFEFQVRETHHHGATNTYSGFMFVNDAKGKWLIIEVTTDDVQFTLDS